MRNFACWRADDAYAVINPDADALPDHVFRAVHTDTPVQIRERPDRPATVVDSETLLRRFLAPRDHVLVPVVGQSGTGKSHLVRWMRVRLPATASREVIFVPKAQTNLREIVRALVDRLPEAERAQFTAELQGANESLKGTVAQRTAILNELHTALQNDEGDPQSGIDPEWEKHLLDGLRKVFMDHHLRVSHFLLDRTFAADLAEHVFERPDRYRPAEQRRVFTVTDLPLSVGELRKAGADAQEFLGSLLALDDATKEAAASIVNRHVDRAIARCLNITGDRLIDLMVGIRRRLRQEGKSLVLLIEDFARLQGLDRALLQSLIEQREDLCVLRTAFACTRGFYDSVAETVRTRLTFVVDMDVPLGRDGGGIDLARLTARYMNALRHGEASLRDGLAAYSGGEDDFAVRSRCDECEHRLVCHSAFGAIDGYGLYPFTETALETMADRADPEARQRFRIRRFQADVLRRVALSAPEIEAGRFPSSALLADLGGVQGFSPAETRKLEMADPVGWERRRALIQLWEGAGTAKNLPEALQGAFGLETIKLGEDSAGGRAKSGDVGKDPKKPEPPPASQDPIVAHLTDWDNGQSKLSQKAAQVLRPLVYEAIREAIDWDAVGLAETEFAGASRAFRQTSINFQQYAAGAVQTLVTLTLPANWEDRQERFRTVMALQGLAEAKSAGTWDFPGSAQKLACLQECLADWSTEVVRQVREVDAAGVEWDQAAAALTLRASMALLTNPAASTASNLSVVQAALQGPGTTADFTHPRLRDLVQEVRRLDGDLASTIAVRRSAMKGGQKGDFYETHLLLDVVPPLRKRGFIPEPPAPNLSPKQPVAQQIARLQERLASELRPALAEEAALRRSWLGEMDAAFGAGVRQAQILAATQELINELGRRGQPVNDLAAARTMFQAEDYDAARAAVGRLPQPGEEKPGDLAAPVAVAMNVSAKLARALDAALARTEPELLAQLQLAGIDPDAERTVVAEIDSDLMEIEQLLAGDRHADAA